MAFWMVRAGEGSKRAAEFERTGYVGIGWEGAGDFTPLTSKDAIRQRIDQSYPDDTVAARIISAGQAHRYRNVVRPGDRVVTYDGDRREYLLGTVEGDYEYRPGVLPGFDHVRRVSWQGRVPKDVLRRNSNNTLGSALTLFAPGDAVQADLEDALSTGRTEPPFEASELDADGDHADVERALGGRVPRDRMSAPGARRALENICPDPAPRAVALETLARLIRTANAIGPASWSVTLHPSLVRLNVGGIVLFDITRHGLYQVVYGPALDEEVRTLVAPFQAEAGFRSIPEAEAFLIPYASLEPALSTLRPATDAVIAVAIDKMQWGPYKNAHSPGVLAYLREMGVEVPDATFVPTRGADDRDAGTRVETGSSSPPQPQGNPALSIEDIAVETGIAADVLQGWIRSINRKGQAIVYGPPGTGKTYTAERLARHLVAGGDGIVEMVQFHPAYAYEDFIQGLRPTTSGDGRLQYTMVPGRFLEFCRAAAAREGASVLIIDEINRANLSQVFGELMYLLEYRDREVPLAGGGRLRIPANVRIIGTMNTADRSIALVDHALRRRFAFIRLGPDFGVLQRFHSDRGRDVSGLVEVLERVNTTIGNPHYSVGISYFMRESLPDDLEAIWRGEIEPYLEEIFFDRPEVAEELRWSEVRAKVTG